MVDELTQESFQTGKAIVTVSVDLITAIADACKRSEQQNPGMSEEQKGLCEGDCGKGNYFCINR